MITIYPLTGIREVASGIDIAGLLAEAFVELALKPHAGDILVVTQKTHLQSRKPFCGFEGR
jgi:hypothetical protein